MIDRIEHFFRVWRRRFSRSEWIIRLLRLPICKDAADQPGIVLIQIDGLSRRQMERALERGRMPFLRHLIQREHYDSHTFYSGMPSSTPAVQGELFYNVRCAVPAFSFLERHAHRVTSMFRPECALSIEKEISQHSEGLLTGGSSWSNIYSGGASVEDTHLCSARLGFKYLFRRRPLLQLITFPFLYFPALLRMIVLIVIELGLGIWDLLAGVWRGENLWRELHMAFSRVVLCIGLREWITIGAKTDVTRGVPIVHLNFIGYDEQSHRRGPSSAFAHWTLRGIDRAIKNIYRAAHRSARREYQVWIFSDHGHEASRPFIELTGHEIEEVICAAIDSMKRETAGNSASRAVNGNSHSNGCSWDPASLKGEAESEEQPPFTVAAMGPLGHLYIKDPEILANKRRLAVRLVHEGRVPGVLVRDSSGRVEWIHRDGKFSVPQGALAWLPHPEGLREELAQDLVRLCEMKLAGDLILVGWSRDAAPVSFVLERGAHAGPGPEETQGFVLAPPLTRVPDPAKGFLRPADLRASLLHALERERLPGVPRLGRTTTHQVRVMTYNVHSCRGMDGRTSPRRIAQVIERYRPDIVALQELDLGRVRSQQHDQPRLIAEALDMHLYFCPTVIDRGEQYGHALLSRFPMRLVRTEILCRNSRARHVEPRGALWVCVEIDGIQFNLMNTHFGLNRRERVEQAAELLGQEWIGRIPEDEPLILCGDFNMFPRSQPYRALARRLRDVQAESDSGAPQNTFTTFHPFARIDHIFVSRHFTAAGVVVPRNFLTRVASDHLPLIADLVYHEGSVASGRVEVVTAAREA